MKKGETVKQELKKAIKKIIIALFICLTLVLMWGGFQYWSIWKVGEEALPEPADVIIVLGAAVWPEGPSPALQGRILHAVELYNKGYADNIILSGGLGLYPPTEAEVMKDIMLDLGIKKEVIHLEKEARNTVQNISFSKEIMKKHDWKKAIIVSDTFHLKRTLLIAKDLGIDAYGSGVKNSILYKNQRLRRFYTLREVLALTRYCFLKLFYLK